MDATWIVSANTGQARIFSQEHPTAALVEVNDMVNTAVHLRAAETEPDRIGQRSASKSQHSVGAPTQPSGYQPNQTPSEHQTELFARDVADYLLRGLQDGSFKKLILVASPEFLGALRKQLDPNVASAVSQEITKDYTHSKPKQLLEQIQAQEEKS